VSGCDFVKGRAREAGREGGKTYRGAVPGSDDDEEPVFLQVDLTEDH